MILRSSASDSELTAAAVMARMLGGGLGEK